MRAAIEMFMIIVTFQGVVDAVDTGNGSVLAAFFLTLVFSYLCRKTWFADKS